jgi:hypothetical protein
MRAYCAVCKKSLLPGKTCKNCYPQIENSSEKKDKVVYLCTVQTRRGLCGNTDVISTQMHNGKEIYVCRHHYEKHKTIAGITTDIQQETDRRAELFKQSAKEVGMTNYEFYRDYLSTHDMFSKIN